MHIVHVSINVKPDQVEAFKAATLENVQNSRKEPGIARFDLVQQADDPARFLLVEVYQTLEDAAKHKETSHYKHWRERVEPFMASPRGHVDYLNIFPDETS